MPEGDTLRRLADRIGGNFGGQTVKRSVFRHPRLATVNLQNLTLTSVEAVGKNLLCRFDNLITLHIHLLMQGRVRLGRAQAPEWRRRFEIEFETGTIYGIDIPKLHIVNTRSEAELVGHLGPDTCGVYNHPAAIERLSAAPNLPLTAALLNQKIVAGFGNIYAVETPFICGLNPFTPVGKLKSVEPILAVGTALIRTNASSGPQNTTGRNLRQSDQWILPSNIRQCKICGSRLSRRLPNQTPWQRKTVWCSTCQPAEAVAVSLERVARLLALHPAKCMLNLTNGQLTADTSQKVVSANVRRSS